MKSYKCGNLYIPATAVHSLHRGGAALLGSYNAASRSPESMRAFAGSDMYSADMAQSRDVRRLISSRARNEFANNSFAYGIIETLANDTIGQGPVLQLDAFGDLDDVDFRQDAALQRRERRFHRWAKAVDLTGILRCARIAKAVDGETFICIETNRAADREVRIEPRIYEMEYVSSDTYTSIAPLEYFTNGQPVEIDGIIYDSYGNPLRYRFWRIHPGNNIALTPRDSREIPAEQVLHYANLFRAGQHRGVSEMLAALNIFNDLRRYSTAVVLSAEVAARLSFIISNDLPPELYENTVAIDDSTHELQTALDLQGGPGQYHDGEFNSLILPAGYHANQMHAEQPTNSYTAFRDAKINEAARVFNMPFNVAAGNSSSYNYASGRLDHQVYHRSINIERQSIESKLLDPLYRAWQSFDELLHPADYEAKDVEHTWMWDGFEHVDPVKEANAQATRLASGTTSLFEECAAEGKDGLMVLRHRIREYRLFQRNGLPLPAWMSGAPASQADTTEDDKNAEQNLH